MLGRRAYIFSGILHVAVVILFLTGLPQVFQRKIVEDTPIAVQLVNVAPQTRATQVTQTPPVPQAKPEIAQNEPKPEPPKPTPPTPPPPAP